MPKSKEKTDRPTAVTASPLSFSRRVVPSTSLAASSSSTTLVSSPATFSLPVELCSSNRPSVPVSITLGPSWEPGKKISSVSDAAATTSSFTASKLTQSLNGREVGFVHRTEPPMESARVTQGFAPQNPGCDSIHQFTGRNEASAREDESLANTTAVLGNAIRDMLAPDGPLFQQLMRSFDSRVHGPSSVASVSGTGSSSHPGTSREARLSARRAAEMVDLASHASSPAFDDSPTRQFSDSESDSAPVVEDSGQLHPVRPLRAALEIARDLAPDLVVSAPSLDLGSSSFSARFLQPSAERHGDLLFKQSADVLPAVVSAFESSEQRKHDPKGLKRYLKFDGIPDFSLPNDLPKHLWAKDSAKKLPSQFDNKLERSSVQLLRAHSLGDSLQALMFNLLFAPVAGADPEFRDDCSVQDVMTVMRAQVLVNNEILQLAASQFTEVVKEKRQKSLQASSLSHSLRPALIKAPFCATGLFGSGIDEAISQQKDVSLTAALSNLAKTDSKQKHQRPAPYSSAGRRGHSYRGRSSRGSRGSSRRERSSNSKANPQ